MSTKGPLFSDIGKRARDLLNKDYSSDQKISITTFSEAGVAINSSLAKKGGLSLGDVAVQYKCQKAAFDIKVDTETSVSTKLTVTDLLPSTKAIASFKFPDYKSGKVEAQYLHDHASFTAAVGLNKSPAVDFSAMFRTPTIAYGAEASFGAEASYATASKSLAKYTAGVSLSKPDSSISVILADKGDFINASYLRHFSKLNGGATVLELSRRFSTNESTLTLGGSFVVDPQTTVKARFNNHGNVAALLQHEISHKSTFTFSGAVDTNSLQKEPKFGLALSLKP